MDIRGSRITHIGSTERITPEIERVWRDHGAGLRGSYDHTHRIHRTDNPGNERVLRDYGADLRGAMITRIGSTELITPDMRGCGEMMARRDYGADIRGAMITRIGSTELITPEMRGCGEIMVRI